MKKNPFVPQVASSLTSLMLCLVAGIGCGSSADAAKGPNEVLGQTSSAVSSAPPAASTNLAPTGAASVNQVFSWVSDPVNPATNYRLWSAAGIDQQFLASALGCSVGGTTCTTQPITLPAGTMDWYVDGQNASGWGPWAGPATITVTAAAPPAASTMLSPVGAASTSQVFSWTKDSTNPGTSYRLWSGAGIDVTYAASALGCDVNQSTTCVTPAVTLPVGNTDWYVDATNSAGTGPWAGPANITVSAPPPGASTALSPVGAATTHQVFSWTADSVNWATSYRLWSAAGIDQTFTASALGCGPGLSYTCTTPAITLPSGTYDWYVDGQNATGWGPWAGPANITVTAPTTTAAPTMLAPVGAATASQVFSWVSDPINPATNYRLWSAVGIDMNFLASDLGCTAGGSTCRTTAITLPSGTYDWYVDGQNASGWGPWAGPANITVP